MVKSRDQKGGPLSPLKAVWRWFSAPTKNPHAAEDRENKRRRDKRKRASTSVSKSKTQETTASLDSGAELAFVDKAGNVRLNDGGRIVARAGKSSKTAAFAAARSLYENRKASLVALEASLGSDQGDLADVESQLAKLKTDLRDAPGLGDIEALEAQFDGLELRFNEQTQSQWRAKREIIGRLEGLSKAAPSALPQQIDAISREWSNSGSAGAVHDTVLERRYAAGLEVAHKRLKLLTERPDILETNQREILDALVDVMASEDRGARVPRLEALEVEWVENGGADDPELAKQFDSMAQAIRADAEALKDETETLRSALQTQATQLARSITALNDDARALADGQGLRELSKKVGLLERQDAGSNRDITDPLRRQIADLQWRADREFEKRRSQAASFLTGAKEHLGKATVLPEKITSLKEWRTLEDSAKTGLNEAEGLLAKLKDLGRAAVDEAGQLSNELKSGRKALNEARKSFFESLDEDRETNGFRKKALLDRLRHAPQGASPKELDAHVDSVMTDWKAAGSAGRDEDQALWDEFQELRAAIRGLRDEASAAERDDFGARLAEAFTRKRALSYTLEDEIRMGNLVLENQTDAKFAKELKRKERKLEALQKDLADIQRKLGKLSKARKSPGNPLAEAANLPSDAAS